MWTHSRILADADAGITVTRIRPSFLLHCSFAPSRLHSLLLLYGHVSTPDLSSRIRAHLAARHSARACRTWLDEHGHRRHHDGRTPAQQRGRHGRRKSGLQYFYRARTLWWWPADGTGYARLAGFWRRPARALPSFPNQHHLPQHSLDAFSFRSCLASPVGARAIPCLSRGSGTAHP